MTLQGTTENHVMDLVTGKGYQAKLGSTTDANEAKALLDSWKKKVVAVVGNSYEVMKDDHDTGKSAYKGYMLMGNKTNISIYSIQYNGEENINTYLLIMKIKP